MEMGEDLYERLPTSSIAVAMSAGALAGIVEHSVMFPVDSVKTRMQRLEAPSLTSDRGLYNTFRDMVRKEGPLRPLRGINVMVLGAGPAHAIYFSCYEQIKDKLRHRVTPAALGQPFIHGTAGCFATIFHDAIMTPADAVKQRLQMFNSPFTSSWECIRKMYSSEGTRAFYRSYTTQLSMNIPFQSIHFMVYEFMQGVTNVEGRYNPKAHMLSGAMAGAVAAAVTTPLDVCKTLLNTQESGALRSIGKPEVVGMFAAIKTVSKVRGIGGFFSGMSARVLYQVPSTALAWSVYEFFKFFFRDEPDGPHLRPPATTTALAEGSRPHSEKDFTLK